MDASLISEQLLMEHFLKKSQINVAVWFFPVETDLFKLSVMSEELSVEIPFSPIIVLSLKK